MTSEAFVTMRLDGTDVIRHKQGCTMAQAVKSRLDILLYKAEEGRILVTFGTGEAVWTINEDGTLGLGMNVPRVARDNYIKIAKEAL